MSDVIDLESLISHVLNLRQAVNGGLLYEHKHLD